MTMTAYHTPENDNPQYRNASRDRRWGVFVRYRDDAPWKELRYVEAFSPDTELPAWAAIETGVQVPADYDWNDDALLRKLTRWLEPQRRKRR